MPARRAARKKTETIVQTRKIILQRPDFLRRFPAWSRAGRIWEARGSFVDLPEATHNPRRKHIEAERHDEKHQGYRRRDLIIHGVVGKIASDILTI
jgi:hypothetical protein